MEQNYTVLDSQQVEADICRKLEAVRLMKNISQTALAEQAGVSRRTISRMENGQGISLNTLIRIMRALNLESHLETLVPSTEIRPIDRVQQKSGRKHASSPRKKTASPPKWEWAD